MNVARTSVIILLGLAARMVPPAQVEPLERGILAFLHASHVAMVDAKKAAEEFAAVTREAGGMPEALGGSGVLFGDLEPPVLAELMHRVATDPALRPEILASQARRLAELRRRDLVADCRKMVGIET